MDVSALLSDPRRDLSLDPGGSSRPTLICVGRLGVVKGQANLVQAWASRGLWRLYNLVLVGGDLENPSPEERRVRDQIRESVPRAAPWAGSVTLRPCPTRPYGPCSGGFPRAPPRAAAISTCGPSKEEFGLSILEAMAESLPVCAPLAGGPSTYIRHGINGFLIDTRDAETLGRELRAVLENGGQDPARAARIKREARRTVEERYSLEVMAREYSHFLIGAWKIRRFQNEGHGYQDIGQTASGASALRRARDPGRGGKAPSVHRGLRIRGRPRQSGFRHPPEHPQVRVSFPAARGRPLFRRPP